MAKAIGYVIYRGPSMIDGAPIVAIATGYGSGSTNAKTGAMIQTYIIREDMLPVAAKKTGADVSVCGECPHRGVGGKGSTCYVKVFQGPTTVFKAYHRGRYADGMPPAGLNRGRMVRLGSYGDPAAVPVAIWEAFTTGALGWTGYTHQWRTADVKLARYCMASCDTVADRGEAKAAGWRTFRVSLPSCGDVTKLQGEAVCPASAEAGAKIKCEACKACSGTATGRRGDITIQAHGGFSVMANLALLHARLSTNGAVAA
jgi:hypothetical protein